MANHRLARRGEAGRGVPPPRSPPCAVSKEGCFNERFNSSSSIQARRYDISILRAAAEIEPCSATASSSATLPGPIATTSPTLTRRRKRTSGVCRSGFAGARFAAGTGPALTCRSAAAAQVHDPLGLLALEPEPAVDPLVVGVDDAAEHAFVDRFAVGPRRRDMDLDDDATQRDRPRGFGLRFSAASGKRRWRHRQRYRPRKQRHRQVPRSCPRSRRRRGRSCLHHGRRRC